MREKGREWLSDIEERWAADLRELRLGDCLEPAALLELATFGTRARSYSAVIRHVSVCAECSTTLKRLRQADKGAREYKSATAWYKTRRVWLALAPAAAAVVAAALWMGRESYFEPPRGGQLARQPALTQPEETPPERVLTPAKVNEKLSPLRTKGPVFKVAQLTIWEGGKATEGRTALPGWSVRYVRQLSAAPKQDVYRAASPSILGIQLTQPSISNGGLLSERPTFRWKPVLAASGYSVQIKRLKRDGAETMGEFIVSEPGWQPSAPLKRGAEYVVHIQARTDDPFDAPASLPAGSFRFRILSGADAAVVTWALQHSAEAPIASAMILHNHGMCEVAAKLARRWPKDRRLSAWSEAITRRYEARRMDPTR